MSSPAATELITRTVDAPSLLDRIAEQQASIGSRYMPSLTVDQFIERDGIIRRLKDMLVADVDYGVIPGTDKPVLLKPGAEKVCMFFGYVPTYTIVAEIEDWTGAEHGGEPLFYFRYACELQKDRQPVGAAEGSCNSWEAKYRYRVAKPKCPACGQAAIIAGKQEWGGGWLCHKKQGGCGSKFPDNDARITDQPKGRVPNPDFADVINTCQKMGQKRAYISAVLSATGLSAYFTVDLEDLPEPPQSSQAAPTMPSVGASSHSQPEEREAPATNGAVDARPVPEELRLPFERIKEKGGTKVVFQFIQDELMVAGGELAKQEWERRTGELTPAQKRDYAALKSFALDMWDRVLWYRAEREKIEDYRAGHDDLPDVFGPESAR